MPLLCAIAIVRPEMKVIRGDSSVLLPGSSLHSARASKNYNLILFRTILHPPDSFVSKNEGMAEDAGFAGGYGLGVLLGYAITGAIGRAMAKGIMGRKVFIVHPKVKVMF